MPLSANTAGIKLFSDTLNQSAALCTTNQQLLSAGSINAATITTVKNNNAQMITLLNNLSMKTWDQYGMVASYLTKFSYYANRHK